MDRTGASVGCFPSTPSPFRRVGVHDFTFEACSDFTRVTARRIAQPPKAAFVTRLQPARLPDQAARQTTSDGMWRLKTTADDVDPLYLALLSAYEDSRFAPPSRRRSAVGRARRRPAGARTAASSPAPRRSPCRPRALLEPRPRTFGNKLIEAGARRAARLALLQATRCWRSTCTLAPMRRQSRGRARRFPGLFRQGAASSCSAAEAALLVAHPAVADAPPARSLARRARRPARDRVLVRGLEDGVIDRAAVRHGDQPAGSRRSVWRCR